MNLLRHFVEPGTLAFDIGANRGDRTDVLRRLGATVVAVEPHKETADGLRRRFGRDQNVIPVEQAVTSSAGQVLLHVNVISELNSISPDWIAATEQTGRFAKWGSSWVETRTVCATTLDELIGQFGRPRFCKIDVEGAEADVLRGLSAPIDAVALEFTSERPESTLACAALLERIGFTTYNVSYSDRFSLEWSEWRPLPSIQEWLPSASVPGVWGDLYAC